MLLSQKLDLKGGKEPFAAPSMDDSSADKTAVREYLHCLTVGTKYRVFNIFI